MTALLGILAFAGLAQAAVYTDTVELNGAGAGGSGTASTATGTASIVVDTGSNTLSYTITFSGLQGTETAAHIHGFCLSNPGCSPVHTLPAGSPKVGVWNYLEAQEADILAGLTYINIHSTVFSGGEIGGQIDALTLKTQDVPATSSWALALLSALILGVFGFVIFMRRRAEA